MEATTWGLGFSPFLSLFLCKASFHRKQEAELVYHVGRSEKIWASRSEV